MASHFSTLLIMAPCRRLQFNLSDLYPVPRLGLGYLSATLKANGYPRTQIRDLIALREWIPGLLAHLEEVGPPDLLGLSVTLLSLREAFDLARAVKGRFPAVKVVVGGPGVGFSAKTLLSYGESVDFFVRGEGEAAMLALVRALDARAEGDGAGQGDEASPGALRDALAGVPGLLWRDGGDARENPRGPFRELDDGIFQDYAAQPLGSYRLHPPMGVFGPATMMETARGCSFPCEFCCLSMPVRTRGVESVLREVSQLTARYGYREIHFVDPTFTLNRERALQLCEALTPLGIRWSCKTRVDRIDEALAVAMARSGCYLIAFGVESGDDAILSQLGKRADADQALDAFEICRRHRIRTTAYLLVGNPGETDETVEANVAWVRRLRPDYVLYDVLQADPLNPMTRDAIAAGLFSEADLERYYLSEDPTRLSEVTVVGHPVPTTQRWLKRCSAAFYARPGYVLDKIRDLRSLQDVKNLGVGGFALLRDAAGVGRLWQT